MALDKNVVQECILDIIVDITDIDRDRIDVNDDLTPLDFDSLKFVLLISEIEDRLDLDLDPSLLADSESIAQLAEKIISGKASW